PAPPVRLRGAALIGDNGAPAQEGFGGRTASSRVPHRGGALEGEAGPAGPPGLLGVVPPDGNGAEAGSYGENVCQKALKDRYYIAVAVAPRWSVDQSIVWVTRENSKTVKDAKFTTESFAAEIVKDMTASHTIASDHIFLHGAMESGPVV